MKARNFLSFSMYFLVATFVVLLFVGTKQALDLPVFPAGYYPSLFMTVAIAMLLTLLEISVFERVRRPVVEKEDPIDAILRETMVEVEWDDLRNVLERRFGSGHWIIFNWDNGFMVVLGAGPYRLLYIDGALSGNMPGATKVASHEWANNPTIAKAAFFRKGPAQALAVLPKSLAEVSEYPAHLKHVS